MAVRKRRKAAGGGGRRIGGVGGGGAENRHTRINQCHNFSWSLGLWKKAAADIAKVCIVLSLFYIALAWILAHNDGLEGINIPYFIAATCTTVKLGGKP